jgi:NDP-mannose synthase
MQAVILAGGKGTRLSPYTTSTPKPLVPIDGIPILEVVLRQLKYFGFTDVVIAVNHLAELIMEFFGKGEKIGLNIRYSIENEPLGTAAPLLLIHELDDTFLVMNGDILTTLNFRAFFEYHKDNRSDASIAVSKKEIKIDLGVLRIDQSRFVDYIEKPTYKFDVSMGIYAMQLDALKCIPENQSYDIPEFMLALKNNNKKITCYDDGCYWLDIGRPDDYETANIIFSERKSEFLLDG